MKKFTKILEDVENNKFFKIKAEVELTIPAETEGEASYIADYAISSIKDISNHTILNVEETSERFNENESNPKLRNKKLLEEDPSKWSVLIDKDGNYIKQKETPTTFKSPEENIVSLWNEKFGETAPTTDEKFEFYHYLRSYWKYDGILIQKVLKDKLGL